MIRRELKSQLIELEKRYAPVVKAKRDKETAPARWAHFHALQVAAVASYGEPKMEEPLRVAYSRMKEKLGEELFAAAVDEWWSALCLTLFAEPMTISSLNEYSPRRLFGS